MRFEERLMAILHEEELLLEPTQVRKIVEACDETVVEALALERAKALHPHTRSQHTEPPTYFTVNEPDAHPRCEYKPWWPTVADHTEFADVRVEVIDDAGDIVAMDLCDAHSDAVFKHYGEQAGIAEGYS